MDGQDGVRDRPYTHTPIPIPEHVQVRSLGWRAALIEPMPALVSRLRRNYKRELASGRVSVHGLVVQDEASALRTDRSESTAARAQQKSRSDTL